MIDARRVGVAAWVAALLLPAIASAQPPRNPFADLFGRAPEKTAREYTRLDFKSTTGVQTAKTLDEGIHEQNGILDGISAGADAALSLEHIRDRFQARGHGRGSYQEYRQDHPFGAPAYDAGAQVVFKPTTRLSFDAAGRYMRSPYFHALQFGAPDIARLSLPVDGFATRMINNQYYEASAGITSNYSRRSSISLVGSWREFRFDESVSSNDFMSRGVEAQWRRRMTRDLGIHAGYGYDEIDPVRDNRSAYINERIDIGVDYSKSLSIARRTALSFSTETSMARENDGPRHYRLNGTIDFVKMFQRTWQMAIGARRTTDFLPGFGQPLLSDRAHASLAGYLSKRLILQTNADAGQGRIGYNDDRSFMTYSGDARVVVAFSRHLGLFTQYVYYHYELPTELQSSLVLPRLTRHAVSIGLQAWVPLIDKDKVTRDPR